MKRTIAASLTFSMIIVLLSSCASEHIPKTPRNDSSSVHDQRSADLKTILDLRKQLAAAKKNETALSNQIERLKDEINQKETLISIQGKVISLLDDADQTLQKSIEAQIDGR